MKLLKNILFGIIIMFIVLNILMLISVGKPKSRQEARCSMGLELYHKNLDFKYFYKDRNCLFGNFFCGTKKRTLLDYKITTDQMLIFNHECKEYNASEDIIIKENLKKVKHLLLLVSQSPAVKHFSRSHVARGNAYSNPSYQKHSTSSNPSTPS